MPQHFSRASWFRGRSYLRRYKMSHCPTVAADRTKFGPVSDFGNQIGPILAPPYHFAFGYRRRPNLECFAFISAARAFWWQP